MAGLLTLVISFLARIAGLGKVSDIVLDVVKKIRAPIDKAMDFVVTWIVTLGKAVLAGAKKAVSGWWKAKKSFALRSGEKHTIATSGDAQTGQLVIRSEEHRMDEFLKEFKTGNDAAMKADLTLAKGKYAEIVKMKSLPQPANDDETKTRATAFDALIDALADILVRLMSASGTVPKATPPVYGGSSPGGFGMSADVTLLTGESGGGSTPDQEIEGPIWKILARRRERTQRYYRLGHLLNHHIGGPGTGWFNLAPQSRSGNAKFSSGIEEKVKKAVSDKTNAVKYRVRVIYGGGKPADFPATQPYERYIAGLEKQYVPSAYKAEASYLWKGGKRLDSAEQIFEGTFDNIIDRDKDYRLRPEDRAFIEGLPDFKKSS